MNLVITVRRKKTRKEIKYLLKPSFESTNLATNILECIRT